MVFSNSFVVKTLPLTPLYPKTWLEFLPKSMILIYRLGEGGTHQY